VKADRALVEAPNPGLVPPPVAIGSASRQGGELTRSTPSRSALRWFLALLALGLIGQGAGAASCVPETWQPPAPLDLPLAARIQPAPREVTRLALRRNLANGVPIEPRPARPDHPLAEALAAMLAHLPEGLRRLAEEQVAAVYLVEDNFGSARVEALRDSAGRVIGGCILLNLDALMRSANAWASWREASAFRHEAGYRIELTLEPAATDGVEGALRFVFLHELGHILGMVAGVHGFWAAPETWWLNAQSPYIRISWPGEGDGPGAGWRGRFPVLALPRFYRFEDAPLPQSAAPLVYRLLGETDLPSLYGSIDPYEDFAETFAIYVHTRLLGRPFRVDLHLGPRHIGSFRSCLDSGRCPGKLAFMESLFAAYGVR